MSNDRDPFSAPISTRRPLLGVTILLVEDSRFCSEAVRLMTMRSGARLRRADCMKSAHKHLAMYRPDLVIVDIGLPDGSGLELIRDIRSRGMPILAVSGTVTDRVRTDVLAAGADGFLPKPIGNMKQFQEVITSTIEGRTKVPGFVPGVVDAAPDLDQQALHDDLSHIGDVLSAALPERDLSQIEYCAQFVSGVAQTAHDQELMNGTAAFFQRMEQGSAGVRDGKTILELIEKRLKNMPRSGLDKKNVA